MFKQLDVEGVNSGVEQNNNWESPVEASRKSFWSKLTSKASRRDKGSDNYKFYSDIIEERPNEDKEHQTILLWGKEVEAPIDELWNLEFPTYFTEKNNARKAKSHLETKHDDFETIKKKLEDINTEIEWLESNKSLLVIELEELKKVPEPEINSLHFSFVSSEKVNETAQALKDMSDSMREYSAVKLKQEKIEEQIAEIDAMLLGTSITWWEDNDEGLIIKRERIESRLLEAGKILAIEKNYQTAQRMITEVTNGENTYEDEKIAHNQRLRRSESLIKDIQTVTDFTDKWGKWTLEELKSINNIARAIGFSWDTTNQIWLQDLGDMLTREKQQLDEEIEAFEERESELNEAHKAIDIHNYFEFKKLISETQREVERSEENLEKAEKIKVETLEEPELDKLKIKRNRIGNLLELKRDKNLEELNIERIREDIKNLWNSLRWTTSTLWEIETLITLGRDFTLNDVKESTTLSYLREKWLEQVDIPTARTLRDNIEWEKKWITWRIERLREKLDRFEDDLLTKKEQFSKTLKDRTEIRQIKEAIVAVEAEEDKKIADAEDLKTERITHLSDLQSRLGTIETELESKYWVSIQELLSQDIILWEENLDESLDLDVTQIISAETHQNSDRTTELLNS